MGGRGFDSLNNIMGPRRGFGQQNQDTQFSLFDAHTDAINNRLLTEYDKHRKQIKKLVTD